MLLDRSQQEFCTALKAAREARGLKLTDIADATKVCPSYFSALERNDLKVWPKGLFRRSFFRAYVSMIGLPVSESLEEFVRLFPEDGRAATAATPATAPEPTSQPVRLVLDTSWHGSKLPVHIRVATAAIDLAAITLPALALGWTLSMNPGTAVAIVAVIYFTLATVLLAESPAAFCLQRRDLISDALRSALTTAKDPGTEEPAAAAESRTWFSDARRVRPRGQAPGLRVRFKVSS